MSRNPEDLETVTVEIGAHQAVLINKLFGPLWAADLRIWIDSTTAEWVIERRITQGLPPYRHDEWKLVVRTPCCDEDDDIALGEINDG